MAFSDIPQIRKFDGSDFALWKFQMQIILEAKELSSVIDGTETAPENVLSNEFVKWNKKNMKAKLLITTALESKYLQQIMTCQNASDMWKRLSSIHEMKSETDKHILMQRFFEYQMSSSDDIATHITKIEAQVQKLKDLGETITESAVITKVICSLPAKYRYFITAWDSVPSVDRTLEKLTTRLLKEESLNNHLDLTSNQTPEAALCSTTAGQNKNMIKINEKQRFAKTIEEKKKQTLCGYCKKKGHWWRECRKRLEDRKIKKEEPKDNSFAFATELKNILPSLEEQWIADSGASDHMTYRKDWFSYLEEISDNDRMVFLGDGKQIPIKGKGSIQILSFVDGERIEATLKDVLYVPNLGKNLFSIGAAAENGLITKYINNECRMSLNRRILVKGIKDETKLYKLLIQVKFASQANAASSTLNLWHERLGHVNVKKIDQMFKNEVFEDIGEKFECKELVCTGCIYGKQHRQSFNKSICKRSTKVGELIHSDICGPMSTNSPGGSRYFILFKDDYSEYRNVYFLRYKSDALEKFKEFRSTFNAITGKQIKRLRTDNGKEYVNNDFSDYLKKFGISHETTAPYTPQQNGVSERENRTVVESGRSMLHAKNLPTELWAEAVNTAVYVLNRCITKNSGLKTPYEILYNKKPSISHLRVFGCNAFVHVPKEKRRKWDKKSTPMIFVGYTSTSKNYRFWDPKARRIVISRDAIFKEDHEKPVVETVQDVAIFSSEAENSESENEFEPEEVSQQPKEPMRYPLRNRLASQAHQPVLPTGTQAQANLVFGEETLTYEEAMSSKDANKWKTAMNEEFDSLMKNGTWSYEPLPDGKHPIECKWVYRIKRDLNGNERYKARLVVRGFRQQKGIDFNETFSPVVKYDSIRSIIAIAAADNLEMLQLDVKTAFLYGDLDEEILMCQPQGYMSSEKPDHVCKLKKSLYGLKQAPRMWNRKFDDFLTKFGLQPSQADPCVYYGKDDVSYTLLAIYVDDCLVCSSSKQKLISIVQFLGEEFEIKSFDADYFLGIEIRRNRETYEIFLSQERYTEALIDRFQFQDLKPKTVPADPHSKLSKEMSPKCDDEIDETKKIPYRQAIGSLMYLMIGTRPDIAYAVSSVSRYMENPGVLHWNAVKRIFAYLKETKELGLIFGGSSKPNLLTCYCDADFAGDVDSRRSTTGYVFLMNSGPIAWSSQRQKTVSLSTTEAEYISASQSTRETMWLRQLLFDVEKEQTDPTMIFSDNQSSIRLIKNPEFHKRTKHIDVVYHFIREKYQEGLIDVRYICSENQIADILTKPLTPEKFLKLRSMMGVSAFKHTDLPECSMGGSVEEEDIEPS